LGNAWAHVVSLGVNWPFDADGMFGQGFLTRSTSEGVKGHEAEAPYRPMKRHGQFPGDTRLKLTGVK
jgi:hypothetical protein